MCDQTSSALLSDCSCLFQSSPKSLLTCAGWWNWALISMQEGMGHSNWKRQGEINTILFPIDFLLAICNTVFVIKLVAEVPFAWWRALKVDVHWVLSGALLVEVRLCKGHLWLVFETSKTDKRIVARDIKVFKLDCRLHVPTILAHDLTLCLIAFNQFRLLVVFVRKVHCKSFENWVSLLWLIKVDSVWICQFSR